MTRKLFRSKPRLGKQFLQSLSEDFMRDKCKISIRSSVRECWIVRRSLSPLEQEVKMKNWIKSLGMTAYQGNCQVSLSKLNCLCKVDVKKSNASVFINTDFPYCQDLHRVEILDVFWTDILLPQQAKESDKNTAPNSQILRIVDVNMTIHSKQMCRRNRQGLIRSLC